MKYWVLRTEKDTYDRARENAKRGPVTFTWTIGSKAEPGDMVTIYGKTPAQQLGLVGVVLRVAERSSDGRFWTELDAVRLTKPVDGQELQASRSEKLNRAWRTISATGAAATFSDPKVAASLWRRLLRDSPRASRVVAAWKTETPQPFGQDLSRLFLGKVGDPRGRDTELQLQRKIEKRLVRRPSIRRLRKNEILLPDSRHLGRDVGFPDIVLARGKRGLLLIEVKRVAQPGKTRSGVPQLLRYEPALEKVAPKRKVEKWLIALQVHPAVLKEATENGIKVFQVRPKSFRRL